MQPTITLFLSFENGARYLLTLLGSPVCVDYQGFPVAPVVKNPPARAGDVRDLGPSLGREDPREEGMATPPEFLPGESRGGGARRATGRGAQSVGHGCSA